MKSILCVVALMFTNFVSCVENYCPPQCVCQRRIHTAVCKNLLQDQFPNIVFKVINVNKLYLVESDIDTTFIKHYFPNCQQLVITKPNKIINCDEQLFDVIEGCQSEVALITPSELQSTNEVKLFQ